MSDEKTQPIPLVVPFLELLGREIVEAERRLDRPVQAADLPVATDRPIIALADAAPMGVVVQRAGVLRYANRYATDLLGYERRADVVGQPFEQFVHPDEIAASRSRRAMLDSGDAEVEPALVKLRHRDGRGVFAFGVGRSVTHPQGRSSVSVFLDITKYKEAEDALRRAEDELERHAATLQEQVAKRTEELERANAELRALQAVVVRSERVGAAEDLASKVVHAVNSPLTALLGTVQMARERQRRPDATLDRVHRLAMRIQNVVDHTLNLFREGTLDLDVSDARDVVEEVRAQIKQRADKRAVSVRVDVPSRLLAVRLDRVLVVSALVAIAENALDAMPRGGTLTLTCSKLPSAAVAVFRVEDTGAGLSEDVRHRVFEPFVTTKPAGLGMGLAIARGVVLGHRGRIQVEERAAGGTVFRVELPLDPDMRPQS